MLFELTIKTGWNLIEGKRSFQMLLLWFMERLRAPRRSCGSFESAMNCCSGKKLLQPNGYLLCLGYTRAMGAGRQWREHE